MKVIYIIAIAIVCIFAIGIGVVVGLETYQALDASVVEEKEAQPRESSSLPEFCHGNARCFTGTVTRVIDGDTIEVNRASIRFALVDAPELGDSGYEEARSYVANVCPVGSAVLVDEDDLQTGGSYGRIIGLVFCDGLDVALNQAVLDVGVAELIESFCSTSEFARHDWAIRYGCADYGLSHSEPRDAAPSCDPSYPDVCIPPYPPDLDCGKISFKNFRVIGSDPHRFDGDDDGIGCES